MKKAYLGIDIGSISTKAIIIDENKKILASVYSWTEGNPIGAVKKLLKDLETQLSKEYQVVAVGTTGSARKLIGSILNAASIKNEITAHAIGTTSLYPEVRTILEIGGQDSKIILIEDGVVCDYAMNTLCAAGTGSFLKSQAARLGIEVEKFGDIALEAFNKGKVSNIAARCTVFAESDLVHKLQIGNTKDSIVAGLCKAVATNFLNNVGKGKKIYEPIIFQGGVSKNIGVKRAFEDLLGKPVTVDDNSHLMGALGSAILAMETKVEKPFDFNIKDVVFETKGMECPNCPNHCEIIMVYKDGKLIDAWGNRCEIGAVSIPK